MAQSIEERLDADLKMYMKARETDKITCIRQVKSKVQEAVNAKDFDGKKDDALYQKVIASYSKSLDKAIAEMLSAGEKSQALRDSYTAEINFLKQYMPAMLDETQTRALVKQTIAAQGITDVKMAGRVLGALMKEHKGSIDPALAKKVIEGELSPQAT